MAYVLTIFLLRLILTLIARVTVHGKEHIPPDSASYIGVSNHIGRLDPAIVYYLLSRKDIIMLVAEKYKEHSWSRWLAKAVNGIFVDRFNADLGAIREVLRRLKKGGIVAMAPEGTRSPNSSLIQGWDGASYIAASSGLPIIPVGVTGSGDHEVVDRLKHFKRLDIHVYVGEAFTLPPLEKASRPQQLVAYTDEIMCRIAAQLPESYRGIYAEHPRLHEILAKKTSSPLQPVRAEG